MATAPTGSARPAPGPRPEAPGSDFERALGRRILQSERLRVKLLAWLLGATTALAVIQVLLRGEAVPNFRALPLIALAMLLFELGLLPLLDRSLARGAPVAPWLRWLWAAVEVSFPTAATVYLAHQFDPGFALVMPPLLGYSLLILLATLSLDGALCLFTGGLAAAQYAVAALLLLRGPAPEGVEGLLHLPSSHVSRALFLLLQGAAAAFVAHQIRRQVRALFVAARERSRVVEMFGQHVSPSVVKKLLDQPGELATEVRHVCVMFLDIRGFTSFAEKRSPEEVVDFLNTLFGVLIEIVNRHQGIINKFLGDGFMAVFGAPFSDGRDCRNAVAAAEALVAAVEEAVAGGRIPPTRVGIGLHAGRAVTGTVGTHERKEYTIIGDAVNLASRIEGLNKQLDSQILFSDEVRAGLGETPLGAVAREEIQVKGRQAPVRIWQLR